MIYAIRVRLCEMFIHAALAVTPAGYCPSMVEAVVRAYKTGLAGKPLAMARVLPPNSNDEAAA